jgi:ribosomal protein S18 acetylase RimI-like enzyme
VASAIFRSATAEDAVAVSRLVHAAYHHYVDRIGGPPGPLTEDYTDVIAQRDVTVAEIDGSLIGVVVTGETPDGFAIENVAVHPDRQGQGLGRALIDHAEAAARRSGYDSVYLYTHEKMTENLAWYERMGYREYDRQVLPIGHRMFLRKPL